MPRFAANLTQLFTEVPMLDRPDWARKTGFDGVEVLFPYDTPVAEWERALDGMALVMINTPPGDWMAGDRGFAARPEDESRFRDGFLRAAEYAQRLGSPRVHVMAGVARGLAAQTTFTANLAWAAEQAPELTLCIEPMNPDDMPGYFLNDFDQAARIIDDLDNPRIGLQFDLWHAARLHGDPMAVWHEHAHRIRHVQIAGFPARHEPGGGGVSLPELCDLVDAAGLDWISAEYRPSRGTAQGLTWLTAMKARHQMIGG